MMVAALVSLALAMPPSLVNPRARPAPVAQTLGPDEVRARVHAYLNALDTPISQEQWRALGDGAGPVLEEVVADARSLSARRAHALDALGVVNPARAAASARALAPDTATPYALRASAVGVLERGLPAAELRSVVQPLLQDRDIRFRARAAEILSRTGQDCQAVRAQAAAESAAHQGYFRTALGRCP